MRHQPISARKTPRLHGQPHDPGPAMFSVEHGQRDTQLMLARVLVAE
jgi:hypothetical protein